MSFSVVKLLDLPMPITLGNITPKGVYDNDTIYVVGDSVYYDHVSYVCFKPCKGNLPTDTVYWQVLSDRGEQGIQGEPGQPVEHNSLTSLQGGTTAEYYHLSSAQHTLATQTASGTQSGLLSSANWTTFNNKENAITAGTTLQYYRGDKSWQTLDKTAVGLSNVDNTSDANKPISSATQTALNAKENSITSGTTSQYWRGDKTFQTLDKTAVGLSNVDNTSDANKPISSATQIALNAKENTITAGTTSQYYRGDKTWQTLDKVAVGLSNVDNTSDANKPVSSATQTALNAKENTITAGTTSQYWRGDKSWQTLDKSSVGLGNVDNTSDANKPISSATQTALNAKIESSLIGAANGIAPLGSDSKIATTYLPSYVDDVIEVANFAALPVTGEASKIYITLDTNLTYRWSGSAYVEISSSLALGETSSTAYRGDRGATAYSHSQLTTGNPHNVTKTDVGLGNVDNTSDLNKPISTATQTAINNHLNDTTDAHMASSIGNTPSGNLVAVTIQSAVNELQGDIDTINSSIGSKLGDSFESVSKNLRVYPYVLNYTLGNLTSIVYDLGSGNTITKTLNYTDGILTSVVLSGTLPSGILTTKTLTYNTGVLSSIAYS